MTQHQRERRYAVWRGSFLTILVIVGWLFLNGLADRIAPTRAPAAQSSR
ncbi:hypothetical protein [Pseudomonas sp. USHLN015]